LKICVGYRVDGARVDLIPTGADAVARCEPIYESMPGWPLSTVGVKTYDQLPASARAYLERIEALTNVPIAMISTGPDREETILKQAIFDAVNGGEVRVLLGSTQRMGPGTNVQERIVAGHHGDVTWKPSDIEQREGRWIRQGNSLLDKYGQDFEVESHSYVTERTVDAK